MRDGIEGLLKSMNMMSVVLLFLRQSDQSFTDSSLVEGSMHGESVSWNKHDAENLAWFYQLISYSELSGNQIGPLRCFALDEWLECPPRLQSFVLRIIFPWSILSKLSPSVYIWRHSGLSNSTIMLIAFIHGKPIYLHLNVFICLLPRCPDRVQTRRIRLRLVSHRSVLVIVESVRISGM